MSNSKTETMKKFYIPLSFSILLLGNYGFGQNQRTFEEDFEPIRQELVEWDAIRGQWLAESMVAISNQSSVPDRTFPENITPSQMLDQVPSDVAGRVRSLSSQQAQNSSADPRWTSVNGFMSRPNCQPRSGRSYGDPHLESFDGASYSFQTVGEFDLARSNDGQVQVQTRQKAQQENFSLNTAVAMNVGGDRVGIYAEDFPDGNSSTPIRVNGVAVSVTDRPYFLARGGVIRRSRGMYVVDWPTGESVTAQIRNSGSMSFINVTTNIYPCTHGGYAGLMGNGNGIASDDYNTSREIIPIRTADSGPNVTYAKKQHLAFLAKEFAEEHRISMATSLFDYPLGTSTFTFTDRSFPRVHMTIDDLDQDRRDRARQHCVQNGIRDAQMEGCIFDNAYLNLPPTPRHIVDEPLAGTPVQPIRNPIVNTNENPADPVKPSTIHDMDRIKGDPRNGGAQPIKEVDNPVREDVRGGGSVKEDPVRTTNPPKTTDPGVRSNPPRTSEPVVKPNPPRSNPPRTTTPPRTNPTPKPAPSPKPTPPKTIGKPGRGGL